MTILAIADIHASKLDPATGRPSKPMDAFGPRWIDHLQRLEAAWAAAVGPDDTVIIAGDIDWALHLEDTLETLQRIDSWPGRKVLIRGNHDYWWSSKTTSRVRRCLPPSIELLHNNALVAEGINLCGAKGSPVPGGIDWTDENEKLLNREVGRLRLSLEARDPALETLVAMHYPPFYPSSGGSVYKDVLEEYAVGYCVYGHLHGDASALGPKGAYGPVEYWLVAGDYVDFAPVPIPGRRR